MEVGNKVVFLSDVGFKAQNGQTRYDARAGYLGEIVAIENGLADVKLDRGVTSKALTVRGIELERLAQTVEPKLVEVAEIPKKEKPAKPWRKFSYEQLVEFATNNGLEWKRNSNEKVERMWLVAALKASGLPEPDDISVGGIKIRVG